MDVQNEVTAEMNRLGFSQAADFKRYLHSQRNQDVWVGKFERDGRTVYVNISGLEILQNKTEEQMKNLISARCAAAAKV